MNQTRAEEAIRALDTDTVLAALGLTRLRCPACRDRFEAYEDGFGVSVRCHASRCRLGRLEWSWPEWFAAELWRVTVAEAARRILAAARKQEGLASCTPTLPAARQRPSKEDAALAQRFDALFGAVKAC